MENFLVAVNAVIPYLYYLLFGYGAKRFGGVSEEMFNKLNALTFKFFYPYMTFTNIYRAKKETIPSLKLFLFMLFGVLILQGILLLVVPRLVKENERRGVIIQAIYRSNFVLLGLALTESVYGTEALAAAAIIVTEVSFIFNFTAVIILEMFSDRPKTGLKSLLISLCKNPMLQGSMLGLVFFLTGLRLPACIVSPINAFGNMCTPLALFILGGSLHFSAIRGNLKYLVPSVVARLFLVPVVMMSAAYLIGLRHMELFFVFMIAATPVATASYPMAKNMGGDGELAGQLVVISTVLSVFTLFLWIYGMSTFGLL